MGNGTIVWLKGGTGDVGTERPIDRDMGLSRGGRECQQGDEHGQIPSQAALPISLLAGVVSTRSFATVHGTQQLTAIEPCLWTDKR